MKEYQEIALKYLEVPKLVSNKSKDNLQKDQKNKEVISYYQLRSSNQNKRKAQDKLLSKLQ